MPKDVRIILDSGCFYPRTQSDQTFSELGYFQCKKGKSDFKVLVDGVEKKFDELDKLRQGCQKRVPCLIEVKHENAPGCNKTHGVKFGPGFHDELLHLGELYGC